MVLKHTLVVCLFVAAAFGAPSTKVTPQLAKALQAKSSVNVFVKFQGGNKVAIQRTESLRSGSRTQKVTHLVSELKALSQSSQRNAFNLLRARSPFSSATQFWVTNELYVTGANAQLIQQLATLPEVEEIREERIIPAPEVPEREGEIVPQAEWNLEIIEATAAWNLPGGNNGQNVVVANIDTGVRHTHESLKNNYRASYGWMDPYAGTPLPNDGNGHETHTMGTIAGSGGIGVAPGAQWIACKGCGDFSCTESALKACGQWTLCPTLADGSSRDCTQAPRVVSNSWGGGQGDDFYNEVIAAWIEADIIPVFARGNSSPTCGSVGSPGDQVGAIAVGSTTSSDSLSGSSGTGPTMDGRIKPDICAPGNLVRSAWNSGDAAYSTISGTSMATPHVAGAAALLLSQNPNLTYAQVKNLLESNTDQDLADTGRICGGIPSTKFPNNQYGHGRLNARKALAAAISG